MTKRFVLSALFLAATSAVFGAETRVATVKVPFAFKAGAEVMPAGEYDITKSDQSVLFLRSKGKSVAVLPMGAAGTGYGATNKVRFEQVNGQPVLTEVVVSGSQGFVLHH
ncbi:hypothetical protein F183_A47690 [Bryobacterales bacterium F-183]|nr:hypothetical protein F183_A47690 [Bryobacterales bacterium F-183]